MCPANFNKERARYWLCLWFVGFLWLFAVMGYPLGYFSLPVLGVISLGCFLSAFWINNRLVAMGSTRSIGRCPHCHYELRGITSDKCPECGTTI